jgi:YfiH family protein
MMQDPTPTILPGGATCYSFSGWHGLTHANATLKHGFFTARGGVSHGVYNSLNCGLGSLDDPERVRQNRARAASGLGFDTARLFGLRQIHSAAVHVVDTTSPGGDAARPEADAQITNQHNIALGILTADCVPVLFAAPSSGIVGAAHAGWRGAVDGVLETTIAAMQQAGAQLSAIEAVIGPAIQQQSYQVGDDLYQLVRASAPQADQFFTADSGAAGKFRFDLPGFVAWRLQRAGVQKIVDLGVDTYHESAGLFSHRRATHRGDGDCGRQIAIIGWQK